jgi:hypothetical protein
MEDPEHVFRTALSHLDVETFAAARDRLREYASVAFAIALAKEARPTPATLTTLNQRVSLKDGEVDPRTLKINE